MRESFSLYGVPKGIRTPVTAVKGRCPRPLDDGDVCLRAMHSICFMEQKKVFSQIFGARRDRTADPLHAMQMLSQLSYSPEKVGF